MFGNFMLNARFNEYVEKYELDVNNIQENERKYINYTYFSQIHPNRLDRDFELLNQICDDFPNIEGIIGIAITLNDQFLIAKTDIDDILQENGKGKFNIYVLANQDKITVECIISEIYNKQHKGFWFSEMICYMRTQRIVSKWEGLPDINIIYISDEAKETQSYKSNEYTVNVSYIDEIKLLNIDKSIKNEYETTLEYKDSIEFPKISGAESVYVVLCKADNFVTLLKSDDGLLRTSIFDDNVRDYQGNTEINKEMELTLEQNPANFVLYNNGITIVCDKLESKSRTLQIKNPQIVNGCQTCNSLYYAEKKGINLSDSMIMIKFIEATSTDVIQGIVKGTNRQNIVYEEAFETIKKYHKELEDFFNTMETDGFIKVYYERRSKQYAGDKGVKPYQKISIRILIQSMVAMYMGQVEISYRHESKLINDYRDKLFVEGQSYYPYYVAALLASNLEYVMQRERSLKDMKPYKMYLLFMIQELNLGQAPDINDRVRIEEYCRNLLLILPKKGFRDSVLEAAGKFRELMQKWVDVRGQNYRFFIKDNPEFKVFMLKELRGTVKTEDEEKVYVGKVMMVDTDKHGNLFGFIKHKPENIYFNELDNPGMKISYKGKNVSYRITGREGKKRGINVRIL